YSTTTVTTYPLHSILSLFFFLCPALHQDLPSFPTRRSSDLFPSPKGSIAMAPFRCRCRMDGRPARQPGALQVFALHRRRERRKRSEEHTSELQSRGHLVCRLLLEKKKRTHNSRAGSGCACRA